MSRIPGVSEACREASLEDLRAATRAALRFVTPVASIRRVLSLLAIGSSLALGLPLGCSFPEYTFAETGPADSGRADGAGGASGGAGAATSGSGGVGGAAAAGGTGAIGGVGGGLDSGPDAPPPVGCTSDADCAGLPTSHCDLVRQVCVECVADGDCQDPVANLCEPLLHVCVECSSSADCASNLTRRICLSDACVECLVSTDCASNAKRHTCDVARNTCIECARDADCAPGTFCSGDNRCDFGCRSDADCSGGGRLPPIILDGGSDAADASGDASTDGAAGPVDAAPDGDAAETGTGPVPIVLDGGVVACRNHQCVGCGLDADCPTGTRCTLGRCEVACDPTTNPCPAGLVCCDGVCSETSSDPTHCGSCDRPCSSLDPGSVWNCVESQCEFAECRVGFADCDQDPATGCEVDTRSDPDNCNGCGLTCLALTNAAPGCRDSACSLGACNANFEDCNGDPTDGCEVSLLANEANCSACGTVCALENASPRCSSGVCEIASCSGSHKDCDGVDVNGCEVDVNADPNNCLACGNVCVLPNANVGCSSSGCTIASCEPPSASCDNDVSNGCETDTSSDLLHCGGCNQPCFLSHATATCSGGVCSIASCDSGWADCNGDPADGCEKNTNGDEANCGECGIVCSNNHAASYACVLGSCTISCASGFDDCDNDISNGCETDLQSNVNHCDSCAIVCPAGPGQTANCVGGVCTTSACSSPTADCNNDTSDGCETNTDTSVDNCGACGNACFLPHATPQCTSGACEVAQCDVGYGDCTVANGCETRLNTLSNCGACGTPCSLSQATATCSTGTCAIQFCTAPYANCDGVTSNGCEENTLSSLDNCGACGNACSTDNGTPTCANGSCQIACDAGFGNCDASVGNGCETAIVDDVANCGACGKVCAVQNGTAGCAGTACTVASCTAPFEDCDGFYGNGCEANTNDSETHCGGCGQACSLPNAIASCQSGSCEIDVCVAPYEDCDGIASNGCESAGCP